jgi:hypothetical protein
MGGPGSGRRPSGKVTIKYGNKKKSVSTKTVARNNLHNLKLKHSGAKQVRTLNKLRHTYLGKSLRGV